MKILSLLNNISKATLYKIQFEEKNITNKTFKIKHYYLTAQATCASELPFHEIVFDFLLQNITNLLRK